MEDTVYRCLSRSAETPCVGAAAALVSDLLASLVAWAGIQSNQHQADNICTQTGYIWPPDIRIVQNEVTQRSIRRALCGAGDGQLHRASILRQHMELGVLAEAAERTGSERELASFSRRTCRTHCAPVMQLDTLMHRVHATHWATHRRPDCAAAA